MGQDDLPLPPNLEALELYVCPRGHQQRGRYVITAHYGGELEAQSGPICRICYVEWVAQNCPTFPAQAGTA